MSAKYTTLPEFLLWLDPGKTTGFAGYQRDAFMEDHRFNSGQLDFGGLDDAINEMAKLYGPAMWVGWEMYIVTGGGGRATPEPSLETIGAVKSACRRHHVTVLPAVPSAMRNLGSDAKLKRLGWYTPGKRHANDAANHLLSFLLREGLLPGQEASRLFTPD